MTTRTILIALCFLFITIWLEANVTYYASNSIGQEVYRLDEIDLFDKDIYENYVLEVDDENGTKRKRLLYNDILQWEEIEETDGVYTTVTRTDGEGRVTEYRKYVKNLLAEELIVHNSITTDTTYHYDVNSHIARIEVVCGDEVWEKRYLINTNGKLSGAVNYKKEESDYVLDYILLIHDDSDSFCIGTDDKFRLTVQRPESKEVYEYMHGQKVLEKKSTKQEDGNILKQTVDYVSNICTTAVYRAYDDTILKETVENIGSNEATTTEYSYDADNELIEKKVTKQDSTTTYLYSSTAGNRVVTIYENDILLKVVTYRDTEREEKLYLDGEYYTTITYSSDDHILRIQDAE